MGSMRLKEALEGIGVELWWHNFLPSAPRTKLLSFMAKSFSSLKPRMSKYPKFWKIILETQTLLCFNSFLSASQPMVDKTSDPERHRRSYGQAHTTMNPISIRFPMSFCASKP